LCYEVVALSTCSWNSSFVGALSVAFFAFENTLQLH
jgi:hypothetical protein